MSEAYHPEAQARHLRCRCIRAILRLRTAGLNTGGGSIVTRTVTNFNGVFGVISNNASTVTHNTAVGNGHDGIDAIGYSTATHNTVNADGQDDIKASVSTVTNNTAGNNNGVGIRATAASTVLNNTVVDNAGVGLELGLGEAASAYANNVIGGGTEVSGGVQIGKNLCAGGLCP